MLKSIKRDESGKSILKIGIFGTVHEVDEPQLVSLLERIVLLKQSINSQDQNEGSFLELVNLL